MINQIYEICTLQILSDLGARVNMSTEYLLTNIGVENEPAHSRMQTSQKWWKVHGVLKTSFAVL